MVSGINNIEPSFLQSQISKAPQVSSSDNVESEPLNSFAQEDEAIISSEAKLQYELEKFNSGNGDALNLMLTNQTSKFTVEAQVRVIDTKKDMIDTILDMGD